MPTVIVDGLDQIQRDLAKSQPLVLKALQDGLIHAAEPVAHTAEVLSFVNIRNMHKSPEWAKTRIGIRRQFVYVAPKERGLKTRGPDPRRRPNLVGLIMGRSFEPALDVMTPIVEQRVKIALEGVLHSSLAFAA